MTSGLSAYWSIAYISPKISEAKEKLTRYATGAMDGSTKFGSPVTDFLPDDITFDPKRNSPTQTDDTPTNEHPIVDVLDKPEEDTHGVLDHLIAINDGYNRIAEIVEGVGVDLEEMTLSTNTTTEEFTRIGANPSDSSPAAARNAFTQTCYTNRQFCGETKECKC